ERPWLTIILDDYSRAVAGYFLTFENPSAIHTSLVLHQAIWGHHIKKRKLYVKTHFGHKITDSLYVKESVIHFIVFL
ncbi:MULTISPECIES: hypothetical protein, partial [unclassified Bacillus (in: firmicutes)]|uniref:hypothetical protein n=1 Tax=unclassified Bacillus (in: firmicutes) TaxID=185979 RepID=UPI000BFAC57F